MCLNGYFFHNWTKWVELGNLARAHTDSVVGIIQERTCVRCGLKQVRKDRFA